jgi:hypothetical protein
VKLVVAAVLVLSALACRSSSTVDAGPKKPPAPKLEPLEQVKGPRVATDASVADEREAIFQIVPLDVVGPAPPEKAVRLDLDGEQVTSNGAPFDLKTVKQDDDVLLAPVGETYLVQIAPVLAALDDVGADAFLLHPDKPIAWPIDLRDEGAFQSWIDDPEPGKVRVIQRADGFELQTNLGKLAGQDPNGPTVPVRGGQLDLKTLQRGLEKVALHFKTKDVCFVPSFGTEVAQVSRAIATNWKTADTAWFPMACLVYPRPRAKAP